MWSLSESSSDSPFPGSVSPLTIRVVRAVQEAGEHEEDLDEAHQDDEYEEDNDEIAHQIKGLPHFQAQFVSAASQCCLKYISGSSPQFKCKENL